MPASTELPLSRPVPRLPRARAPPGRRLANGSTHTSPAGELLEERPGGEAAALRAVPEGRRGRCDRARHRAVRRRAASNAARARRSPPRSTPSPKPRRAGNAAVIGVRAMLDANRGRFDVAERGFAAAIERRERPRACASRSCTGTPSSSCARTATASACSSRTPQTQSLRARTARADHGNARDRVRAGRPACPMRSSRFAARSTCVEPLGDDVRARLYQQAAYVYQFAARASARVRTRRMRSSWRPHAACTRSRRAHTACLRRSSTTKTTIRSRRSRSSTSSAKRAQGREPPGALLRARARVRNRDRTRRRCRAGAPRRRARRRDGGARLRSRAGALAGAGDARRVGRRFPPCARDARGNGGGTTDRRTPRAPRGRNRAVRVRGRLAGRGRSRAARSAGTRGAVRRARRRASSVRTSCSPSRSSCAAGRRARTGTSSTPNG